uniref:Glutathione S-transferase, C-terminal domain containing n=1 Tax=Cyprinus carpio TaxID=7962 RepID=A0A8C2EK28_CYPCA
MKQTKPQKDREGLYLEVTAVNGAVSLPLLSIVLFLLSYTECSSFHVYLVTDQGSILSGLMPGGLAVSEVRRDELPGLVRMWRLPAALESAACICRAGLAVVLRHIIQRACQLMPSRRDVASLLGFKNTCLKACAEVRLQVKTTRGQVLKIPLSTTLTNLEDQMCRLPAAIQNSEKRLGEPVKVHNDDKIILNQKALAKLSADAVPAPSTRERSDIRKVKTTDLPEHVFAEGLYFTLTDVVLCPSIPGKTNKSKAVFISLLINHNSSQREPVLSSYIKHRRLLRLFDFSYFKVILSVLH